MRPIDPNYKPTKTYSQLAAERPELAGLAQLASAESMANPHPSIAALQLNSPTSTSAPDRSAAREATEATRRD